MRSRKAGCLTGREMVDYGVTTEYGREAHYETRDCQVTLASEHGRMALRAKAWHLARRKGRGDVPSISGLVLRSVCSGRHGVDFQALIRGVSCWDASCGLCAAALWGIVRFLVDIASLRESAGSVAEYVPRSGALPPV